MRRCTWKGKDQDRCSEEATQKQTGSDGVVWADLCPAHAEKVENIMDEGVGQMMAIWISASGGPKKMAERM